MGNKQQIDYEIDFIRIEPLHPKKRNNMKNNKKRGGLEQQE